eukprot:IDg14864t1
MVESTSSSTTWKRILTVCTDNVPAAQPSHAEDGLCVDNSTAKNPHESPNPISMCKGFDRKYVCCGGVCRGYRHSTRNQWRGWAFYFINFDASGSAKAVVAILLPRCKTIHRNLMISNPETVVLKRSVLLGRLQRSDIL